MWVISRKEGDDDWDFFQVILDKNESQVDRAVEYLQRYCPKYNYKYERVWY